MRTIAETARIAGLAHSAFNTALEIGSSNWDSYLAPVRWSELAESPAYKEFMNAIGVPPTSAEGRPSSFERPPEPLDEAPDAPAADRFTDLHQRVADIVRRHYFIHTRNERKAYECAMEVLEEVQRTYERLAAAAGLASGTDV